MAELYELGAKSAARKIAEGTLTSRQLVEALIQRIKDVDEKIEAWAYFDPDYALSQADTADRIYGEGQSVGPLHGVPVGFKDIIDTYDMPTENGTPVHQDRRPEQDAAIVAKLREAGAIILGKTITTELAVFTPSKTRNPHNFKHTPGGSSSGSAAAVASFMVPAAIGTQTGGSIVRPASFCGVFGFKPTFGLVPRTRVLRQSPILDTLGPFARSVEDLALLFDCLTFYDPGDEYSILRSKPNISEIALSEPPTEPFVAIVRTPFWDNTDTPTSEVFTELEDILGRRCEKLDLSDLMTEALAMHRKIHMADIASYYGPLHETAPGLISEGLVNAIEEGRTVKAVDYNNAIKTRETFNAQLTRILKRYDAILTPSSTGTAPLGLESTGNPVFNSVWTFAGVPAVNLPLFEFDGLPLGVQLIGARMNDGNLLRTANWLTNLVERGRQNGAK